MVVHVWAFLAVSVIVIVAPGPDTVLVTKNALLHGRSAALGTSLGVDTGLAVWTVAAAVGIAALVRESAVAFTILKLAGGAYLVWLGVVALRAARRAGHADLGATSPAAVATAMSAREGFRQGLFSNLANPKIAVFFTTLLPQFVSGHGSPLGPFLLLGAIFVLITATWLSGYSLAAVRLSRALMRPRVRAALDGVTGVVLIGLGVRVALERR